MRRPNLSLQSIFVSILDVIDVLRAIPRFEIKRVTVSAKASTAVSAIVRATFPVSGMVQINGTTTDIPTIVKYDTYEMTVTYDYDADTSGEQEYTYLLIGDAQ